MGKRYTLTILFLLCALWANSQEEQFEPEWNIGAGFGPTFSSVDFQTGIAGEKLKSKMYQQYYGGISLRYLSEKNLGFILELNYSQQGWEQDFTDKDNPDRYAGFSHTHTLNYLEVPALTHIYFGNKVRFVFNLGPKLSFLLSDSEEMSKALVDHLASGEAVNTFVTHQYYRKAERKIDYGLMGGMGIEVRTGIGNFMLEGRYTFGLGDIYKNSKVDYFARSANRVISAKLTYYIKLF